MGDRTCSFLMRIVTLIKAPFQLLTVSKIPTGTPSQTVLHVLATGCSVRSPAEPPLYPSVLVQSPSTSGLDPSLFLNVNSSPNFSYHIGRNFHTLLENLTSLALLPQSLFERGGVLAKARGEKGDT